MKHTRPRIAALTGALVGFALIFAVPLGAATSEALLKDFFEGRRVTLRIDMPGTHEGVNVYPQARRDLDTADYRDNLRRYGASLRVGDTAVVTLVKVKKDLIEFQLNGGGYGTFFDDTDTSVRVPYVGKSDRERRLEQLLRDERDRSRRRQLERELRDLRRWRERENDQRAFEAERLSEFKEDRLAFRRHEGGSRFNLRFHDRVPYGLGPDDIMAALAEYVDFDGQRYYRGR
jgi:hypothetical protein